MIGWRKLPNHAALTEFGRYNGDCMWDALLACLHCVDGIDAPLTIDALNTLTARAIADKLAGERGQASLGQVETACSRYYKLEPIYKLGYQVGLPVRDSDRYPQVKGWLTALQAHGGINPIVLMIENAQALPGNEPGVKRHGIAILGCHVENAAYQVANGDSANGRKGQLDYYRFEDILAAQPSGLLVYPGSIRPKPAPAPVPEPQPVPSSSGPQVAHALELITQAEAALRAIPA